MPALREAVERRRSHSRVTESAPTHEELLPLVAAAARVADHSSLRPWRLIELRGHARERLGRAFVAASDFEESSPGRDKLAAKPLRAPLLIAIVAIHRDSDKVPVWEQHAVAAGVAHTLSLLLDEAGWGVMWRTGGQTRAPQVHLLHELATNEELLGWLYVGGLPNSDKPSHRPAVAPEDYVTVLS